MTPNIYIICERASDEDNSHIGFALAEDGTGLVQHWSLHKLWLRYEMGITSKRYHKDYEQHYPQGYMLVDLLEATDEELAADAGFMKALTINKGVPDNA